tara:strand:+ start:694 stop:897 length:204 start_codon:yes stop_codon:yes gene_type:complete
MELYIMSNTKNWVMSLEEKFYSQAEDIVKDSDTVEIAVSRVELLRSAYYNWMDQYSVAQEVEEFWCA